MVSTDLGACEWFVWDLRRSNLIDRGQLDQTVSDFLSKDPGAEPPALADYLVSQKVLTRFQADRVLQGKVQGFVLGPFTLMDALGSGSMGTVYKARSKNDQNWYAVKVLPQAQHVEYSSGPPQGTGLRAVQAPFRRSFRGRGHRRQHALPGLAPGRRRNARSAREAER